MRHRSGPVLGVVCHAHCTLAGVTPCAVPANAPLTQPMHAPHACRYQGWAIRGWNDAAGASRIKALYDTVPKGQWIPLESESRHIPLHPEPAISHSRLVGGNPLALLLLRCLQPYPAHHPPVDPGAHRLAHSRLALTHPPPMYDSSFTFLCSAHHSPVDPGAHRLAHPPTRSPCGRPRPV